MCMVIEGRELRTENVYGDRGEGAENRKCVW